MTLIPRSALAVVAAAAVTGLAVVPATAATSDVTQTVTAGTRSASVANLALGSVAYSHSAQTTTGTATLTADDSTGSYAGWNVTIQVSDFVHGTDTTKNIAASNFALTSAAAPVSTAGQAVDATGGPKVPTTSPVGTLDSPRKTVQASADFGAGSYTQALGVSLTIPAQSAAGTYTGTLTTTIAAAP